MSTFVVFGVCMEDCKLAAFWKVKTYCKVLKRNFTEQEHAEKVNLLAEELYRDLAKPKQISSPFDAPQFANDFIELAKKSLQAHTLKIMVKAPKIDDKGKPMKKKNGLPLLGWTEYKGKCQ